MSGAERLDQVKLRVRWVREELDAIRQEMVDRGQPAASEAASRALKEVIEAQAQIAVAVCHLNFATNALVHGIPYAERAAQVAAALPFTPGQFLTHARIEAGLSIDDVAARISTTPPLAEHVRREWLEMIEADLAPVSSSTIVSLRNVFAFSRPTLERLIETHGRSTPVAHAAGRSPAAQGQPGAAA